MSGGTSMKKPITELFDITVWKFIDVIRKLEKTENNEKIKRLFFLLCRCLLPSEK